MRMEDGFWIFHSNKVDLAALFNSPDEKLWLVVKENHGSHYLHPNNNSKDSLKQSEKELQQFKGGFKLEKNSVIKLGRVRLRVRDMDNEPRSFYTNTPGLVS